MTKVPLVTIGIACFNAEDTIARSVQRAVRQNWDNLEVVVVDDCSTDSSVQMIREFQARDGRLRYYSHKENQGFPSALNTVVGHANGEYIAFFDDDDDKELDRLQKQYVG